MAIRLVRWLKQQREVAGDRRSSPARSPRRRDTIWPREGSSTGPGSRSAPAMRFANFRRLMESSSAGSPSCKSARSREFAELLRDWSGVEFGAPGLDSGRAVPGPGRRAVGRAQAGALDRARRDERGRWPRADPWTSWGRIGFRSIGREARHSSRPGWRPCLRSPRFRGRACSAGSWARELRRRTRRLRGASRAANAVQEWLSADSLSQVGVARRERRRARGRGSRGDRLARPAALSWAWSSMPSTISCSRENSSIPAGLAMRSRCCATLLHEAKESQRLVVITSDHGHVLDRGTAYFARGRGRSLAACRGRAARRRAAVNRAARAGWRVSGGDRPLVGGDSIRDQEKRLPRRRLSAGDGDTDRGALTSDVFPQGWVDVPVDVPIWWEEPARAPAVPAKASRLEGGPKPAADGALVQHGRRERRGRLRPRRKAPVEPAWIARLFRSSIFEQQKKLAGRSAPADEVMRAVFVRSRRARATG